LKPTTGKLDIQSALVQLSYALLEGNPSLARKVYWNADRLQIKYMV
jgi:hypothetical protein